MLMYVTCIFILLLLQPTNAQIFFIYIIFTPTCIHISVSSSGSSKNVYFAKSHKFLKLKPLILQFLEIIRLKYYMVVADTITSHRLAI
jgi:hypothetical protein